MGNNEGSCPDGSMILDKETCRTACDAFEMDTGTLKDNEICYRAGNGKCRQDGRFKGQNKKISPICYNEGNTFAFDYLLVDNKQNIAKIYPL